jgi:hypothetical protein
MDQRIKSNEPLAPAIGIHPAADAFPPMSPSELRDLADDIKTNGLAVAIVRDAKGTVLDGRNRLAACEIAGVKPRFEEYTGNNPVGFIVSANLKRRHLNESQRALVASRLATLSHGGDRRSDQTANLQLEIPKASVAAAMLNISERSLANAAVVRKHGTHELIRDVEQGKISVSKAAKQAQPLKAKPKPQSKPKGGTALPQIERGPHKPSAEERRSYKLAARVRELEAEIAELRELQKPLDEQDRTALDQFKRLYKRKVLQEFKNQIRYHEKLVRQRTFIMDHATYSKILAGLHPDASNKIRDQARQAFERYKKFVFNETDKIQWPPEGYHDPIRS